MGRIQWIFTALLLCTPLANMHRAAEPTITAPGIRLESYATSGVASATNQQNDESRGYNIISAIFRADAPQLRAIARVTSAAGRTDTGAKAIACLACRSAATEGLRTVVREKRAAQLNRF